MKTKPKKRAFLKKAQPNVLPLPDFYTFEAGEDYAQRGQSTDLETALAEAGGAEDQPLRGCIIRCRDRTHAAEIADDKRDELPWVEDLKLRDGALPIGWHGGPLNPLEKRELDLQTRRDKAERRKRLEKIHRQMLRESA